MEVKHDLFPSQAPVTCSKFWLVERFGLAHRVAIRSPIDIGVQVLLGLPVSTVPELAVTTISGRKLITTFKLFLVLLLQLQGGGSLEPRRRVTGAPVRLGRAAWRQEAGSCSGCEVVFR